MRHKSGTTIAQYAIIIILIAIVVIPVLFLLGKNIIDALSKYGNFYGDNLESMQQNIAAATGQNTNGPLILQASNVVYNPDGSVSFDVGDQHVDLEPEINHTMNEIMETVGTAGVDDLIEEIAYMISVHKDEYPGENVPLELQFGTSMRYEPPFVWGGVAATNSSTSIKVGDHIIVLQKDHTAATYQPGVFPAEPADGIHRMEGNIAPDNTFMAIIESKDAFNGDQVSINLNNYTGSLEEIGITSGEMSGTPPDTFQWDLYFDSEMYHEI
jgi:Flp pilus assembly pilin Flp